MFASPDADHGTTKTLTFEGSTAGYIQTCSTSEGAVKSISVHESLEKAIKYGPKDLTQDQNLEKMFENQDLIGVYGVLGKSNFISFGFLLK